MSRAFCLNFLLCFLLKANAGTVDTVHIFSASMQKEIACVVIKPDEYSITEKKFPVVYLLHGYSGKYSDWITKAPELKLYADVYQTIIICPDGNTNSWYFDSPIDSAYRYETHITTEVVGFIDNKYKTIANKNHRAITGLSMGGHGALFLALRHADVFGAMGSMSGGVDLNESKNRFEIGKRIGDTINYAFNWFNLSIVNLVKIFKDTKQKIIFDCGRDDFFLGGNRLLHQKMTDLNIPHEYVERLGAHTWEYWKNSIHFQLESFRDFFSGM